MWTKTAMLLIVQVKTQKHRGLTLPIPVWVVDEFFMALTDLAWVGEIALKHIPLPRDEKDPKHLNWVKTFSPSGIISVAHAVSKDLRKYKGLDVVDVKSGDIQVKISLR